MLGALKIAPALCAGNTMVLKAAEDAPLGVLMLAEICQEFLPPGVLNVLTGYGAGMRRAARQPSDDRASSPSPARPRSARSSCAPRPSASCRCRSNSAARARRIVYPDADEDWAVDGIIAPCASPGRASRCTAGSRLFLHEDIFDSFLEKLEKKTTALKIGDPLDEATDIGTIINDKQFTQGLQAT